MILLPGKNHLWLQNNRSDILGTLWASFNLNHTEQFGKTKVSPRMVITTNGIANLGCPVAFKNLAGDLYTISDNGVFKATGGLLETLFAYLVGTLANNVPSSDISSDYSDAEIFNNYLCVSGQYGGLYPNSGGTWLVPLNWANLGDSTTVWTVSNPSGNTLRFTYTSGTQPTFTPAVSSIVVLGGVLSIPLAQYTVTNNSVGSYFDIVITGASGYTGSYTGGPITNNLTSKEGVEQQGTQIFHKLLHFGYTNRLYVIDTGLNIDSCDTSFSFSKGGASNTFIIPDPDLFATSLVGNNSRIFILTMSLYNGVGHIYVWDGTSSSFDDITLDARGALAGISYDNTVFIIDTNGKLLKYNGQAFVEMPNGQLPVKILKYLLMPTAAPFKANRFIHPNGITMVNGNINILVNNQNNDNGGTIQEALPSGIWEYTLQFGKDAYWYHKSALTQYDYSGAQTISDYGQNRVSRVGALSNLKPLNTSSDAVVGTIIAGAVYFTDASTTKAAIWTNDSLDTIQKRGYLVTNKILSADIQDSWNKLYLRIRQLLNATDKIYLKWRKDDSVATEAMITWINNNSFTTTGSVGGYAIGNEVEILSGTGSGWTPNIASITDNAGTYTVVLDESFATSNLSGTAQARFQTWQRAGVANMDVPTLANFSIGVDAPWIQLKICFLFTGNNEMVDALLINSQKQKE